MLHQGLLPGCDYLLERKLSSIWREIQASPLAADHYRFMTAAADVGFTERVRFATGKVDETGSLGETSTPCGQGACEGILPGFDAGIFFEKDSDYAQAVSARSP